jgi:hypothetical protein
MYMHGQEARWPALAVTPGRGIYLISRIGEAATDAALSAERMRSALLSGASAPAVLQEQCREAARKWSWWKAQQRYRETAVGQAKRNGQSRRYRERIKTLKPTEPKAVNESARVITQEDFFRAHLRPAGLL